MHAVVNSSGNRKKSGSSQRNACEFRYSNDRAGAWTAELAIVLPFLVFLFLVVVDFCRVYHSTETLQNSAHAAALYASGACGPKEYHPPDNLLTGLLDPLAPLLGGNGQPSQGGYDPVEAAKQAAVAEGASLRPPLIKDQVSVTFDASSVLVSVKYEVELLTPILDSSRKLKLERTIRLPKVP
ncbi:MAG: pilus assembly protein [Gemmataceae bacterium]|nr:pilus assembly protein [Gemmataceae bacterium]MCI0739983.1 pilus assembly protein [Gemmataceae bacterium]